MTNFARDNIKQIFERLIEEHQKIQAIFLLNYKNGIVILHSCRPSFFLDIKYFSNLTRFRLKEIYGNELGNPIYNILQFECFSLLTYFIKDAVLLGFIIEMSAIEIYSHVNEELAFLKKEITDFLQ